MFESRGNSYIVSSLCIYLNCVDMGVSFLPEIDIVCVSIGLFFVVDQLAYSSTATACIITTQDQICLVLCKLRSSLATWPASAMASFSCSVA